MAEYSRIARGTFTTGSSVEAQIVNIPFQPQRVELENVTAYSNNVQYATTKAFWDISMPQGTADQEYVSAATFPFNVAADYVATEGISTFAAGQLLVFGVQVAITSSTKGSSTNFTTTTPHGFAVGDIVVLTGLYNSPPTSGMAQMSNLPFVVVQVGSTTTFTLDWDSSGSNYTNLASPPNAFVKKVLYPFLYFPGVSFINGITQAGSTSNTLISCTCDHSYVVGQEVAFRIPPSWGTTQLNQLPNNLTPASPVYYYVVSIPDSVSFVINAPFASLTAFNPNQTIASVPGLDYPQVIASGGINSGGWPYTGGSLYPSPVSSSGLGSPTINGPAIMGAFVNNTAQGFVVGLGRGQAAASQESPVNAPLLAESSQYVWTAYLYDLSL